MELDDCHEYANCTDILGSYTCQCKEGFTGDGKSCQGRDFLVYHLKSCKIRTNIKFVLHGH